jgi:predicted RNA methylase
VIHQMDTEPTRPETVTPQTPLETLNLNWRESDLPEHLRTKHVHRLHPYLGKFIPQLVEVFLRKFFRAGQTVMDPFCGSGTTLVQANELGIHAVGYDVSAFNVLLSRAKTTRYNLDLMEKDVLDALEKVRRRTCSQDPVQLSLLMEQQDIIYDTDGLSSSEYLQKWYAPQALRELMTYRDIVRSYAVDREPLSTIQ